MRARLLCAVVAIGCLSMGPVHADSHDDEGPIDFGFEEKDDWGDLGDKGFGELVGLAWLCGNLFQLYHSFGLEDMAVDFLSPTLALAVREDAGRAQLLIIEEVFFFLLDNFLKELESTEWYYNTGSEYYKKYKENTINNIWLAEEICVNLED